jgi:hypothetical protein
MYNVESAMLSLYLVLRKNLMLNYAMLFDGFIVMEAFITPAGISIGIKLRSEFSPYYG